MTASVCVHIRVCLNAWLRLRVDAQLFESVNIFVIPCHLSSGELAEEISHVVGDNGEQTGLEQRVVMNGCVLNYWVLQGIVSQ